MKRNDIRLFAFLLLTAVRSRAADGGTGVLPAASDWLAELIVVLVLVGLGGALVFLINLQLQRQVGAQKQALHVSEGLLREVEDRWRLAVMSLNVGIWEYNFTTGEMFFSQRWKEMLGYAPTELPDRREEFWDRLHPDDRAQAQSALDAHLAGRSEHYVVECRLRCKNGQYKWIRSRAQVLLDADGRPARLVGAHDDIDAHRQAEAALRAGSERYRALFESNPSPMWVYDQETLRFLMVNDAAVRDYGYTREEFLQKTIFDIRPAQEAERLRAMLAHWRPDIPQAPMLWRHLRKDGTELYVETAARDHEFDGRPGVLVVARDVTGFQVAQEQLAASEERYRLLFENAAEGIYESTPEGFQRVNPAMARLLGFAGPQELLRAAAPLIETLYVRPGRRAEFFAAIGDRDVLHDFESEVRCADGSTRWISENVRVVRDATGRLRHLQGFVSDITERRRAEDALAAERERLRVTLRAMAEGVLTTDAHGVVQFVNEAAEDLTGWRDGEAVGRHLTEVCVLRNEQTQAPVPLPVAAVLGGHRFADLPLGTALLDRQGLPRLVEGRCAPIHDPQSRAVGTVLVLRDVTEQARLESELLRASRIESIGILAGGIAHDFNNLLTAVMGNLGLAMLDPQIMATAGAWLRDAERGVLRARDLTQKLLTFARGGEPVLDPVQLPGVVREAAEFALHGSKVRAEFAADPELWTARVDQGQISQAVQNLVINAVQAMPDGGIVRLSLHNQRLTGGAGRPLEAGNYVCLEVTDQGPGIPPEHLGQIFDPYFTTKKTGNGLGLATVYSIIRRHQGHIEVESPPGHGATFRLWLPVATEPAPRKSESPPPFAPTGGRLLFMDDEEPIRLMAQSLLSRMGFAVTTAADGTEAVRTYAAARERGEPFALVIMDLTVPGGMGGAETIVELRKLDPAVKAIVSSGYSSDPILANYEAYGFSGVVPKPYRLADLAKSIRTVLDK